MVRGLDGKWYETFGPKANCTFAACPVYETSIIGYRPSVPANAIFIALFGLSLVGHIVQGVMWKTWGFMSLVAIGCIDEIIGYGGRLMLYNYPWSYNGLLIDVICITTAPVFFCAAIYVMLSKTIIAVDRSLSRFDPRIFYWTFIPFDVVSLILQAAGGAISVVSTDVNQTWLGVHISLAGLILQVVTLVIFVILFADYLIRSSRTQKWKASPASLKIFLGFLFLSILFIFIRCAYRIRELSEGYFSPFFKEEGQFIGLESVMMVLASLSLNVGHPGIGLKNLSTEEKDVPLADSSNDERNNIK